MRSPRRGFVYVTAGLAAFVLAAFFLPASPSPAAGGEPVVIPVAFVEPVETAETEKGDPEMIALAKRDPAGLTRLGIERYKREVRDYTCVMLKQERMHGVLGAVQEVEVRYREAPLSIYMIWKKNADGAKRALFIDSPEYVDGDGQKAAKVEPNGSIVRLFVSEVMMAIHGAEAMKASRRSIDDFGFAASVRLLDRFNAFAAEKGVLNIRYGGIGEVDGRRTYVILRDLPYTGPDGPWPDARLVMHVDQEWLLPTAIYSYADHEGQELLGSYVFTKVKFNPGLGDAAFKF